MESTPLRQHFLASHALGGISLVLLLALSLVGCGSDGRQAETSTPAVFASVQPGINPAATAGLPSETPLIPPSVTPEPILPSATPIPIPPSAVPTSVPPSTTPTSIPPSVTPTSIPPSSTPTLAPSSTPTTIPEEGARDPAVIQVELQRIAGGLDAPVGVANAGDGSQRLFVVEKAGTIRIVRDGGLAGVPFLDISDRVGSSASEQGLLGLAFHPSYKDNGFFFVNYTDHQGDTVVARFSVGADPAQADPASETVLLALDQPAGNHNGGHLAFGPDGYLYIGTGDGGGSADRFGNGQNGGTLLGAMLRLDVDGSQPYGVPPDNPFVDNPAVREEIWAIGLRNPWRYSFDRAGGDLYIADVGQNLYEEVNVQPVASRGGQNYGWPIMEATHCFPEDRPCDPAGLTLPVAEYNHSQGCSVTGGYVYRGRAFPLLTGIYLFGDYCSGKIWGLAPNAAGEWQVAELAQSGVRPSAFGEDEAGELVLLDMARGELFRITARPR